MNEGSCLYSSFYVEAIANIKLINLDYMVDFFNFFANIDKNALIHYFLLSIRIQNPSSCF